MDRSQYSSYSTSAYNRFGSNQYDSYHSMSNISEGSSSQVRFLITQELHKQSGTTSLLPLSCGKAARGKNISDSYLIFPAAVAHDSRKASPLYRVVDVRLVVNADKSLHCRHLTVPLSVLRHNSSGAIERRKMKPSRAYIISWVATDVILRIGQKRSRLVSSSIGHWDLQVLINFRLATHLIEDYFVLLSVETTIPQTTPFPPYGRDVDVDEFAREQFLASSYQRQ